jgi:hypothetical protein
MVKDETMKSFEFSDGHFKLLNLESSFEDDTMRFIFIGAPTLQFFHHLHLHHDGE